MVILGEIWEDQSADWNTDSKHCSGSWKRTEDCCEDETPLITSKEQVCILCMPQDTVRLGLTCSQQDIIHTLATPGPPC